MMFSPGTRVHVVGVGGAGMSALAVYLAESGCQVSGCDAGNVAVVDLLRGLGVDARRSHDAAHVNEVDVVLWSPAVADDHPELARARERGVTMLRRPRVWRELSEHQRIIGLTGTHGKTTATSMLAHIMLAAGRDDSRLVGAPVRALGFSGHFGPGDLLAEVDESYGAFSEVTPYALGLLNVEADHLDHYGTLDNLEAAFAAVVTATVGPVVVWHDDAGAARVARRAHREVITVGTRAQDDWRVSDLRTTRTTTSARLTGPSTLDLTLAVVGRHNVANAAVAAALAMAVGVDAASVVTGLANFRGAPRRFELLARGRDVDVVDDYAHLPGEIAATVTAARDAGYRNIVVVFQPHRVSRTVSIGPGFAPAFDDVTEAIITDIYTAGEPNPTAVTGDVVADSLRARGVVATHYAATLSDAATQVVRVGENADLILLVGAGDVTRVIDSLGTWRGLERVSEVGTRSANDSAAAGRDRRVDHDAALGARTTYRVGGSVRTLVHLASDRDFEELGALLTDGDRPLWVLGNGSNTLVTDGDHDVLALHLEGEYCEMSVTPLDEGSVLVRAGAGLDLPIAARRLAAEGVTGFEWAVGVPGTFGGAVAMNAGGHGSDMAASVTRVEVWRAGVREWRPAAELAFGYRQCALAPGEVVTRVEMRLSRGDAAAAKERIAEIVRWRREHQPGGANGGSVFRNPDGDSAGRLIDVTGLKGTRVGSAQVSTKHANFILVDPEGRADDVLALMRLVRARVGEATGVWLETEHRIVGGGISSES